VLQLVMLRQAEDRDVSRAGIPIPRVSQSSSFLQHYCSLSMAFLGGISSPKSPVHLPLLLPFLRQLYPRPHDDLEPAVVMGAGHSAVENRCTDQLRRADPNQKQTVYAIAFSTGWKMAF